MKEKDEHRKYYYDGVEVPSCTTIVKLLDKPELVNWANYMGFKRIKTSELLEEKAERGTYCHKLFEVYFNDGFLSANSNDKFLSKKEYREVIYKLKIVDLFFIKMGIKVLRTELPLEGKSYGGTLDILCYNTKKNKLMVLDLKTSKKVYQSHWIQTMGYCQLLEEIYGLHVDEVGIILLSEPYDSPNLVNIKTTEECWRELAIFNKLKDIYYFLNESKEIIDMKVENK